MNTYFIFDFLQTVLNRYNSFTGMHYKDDPTIMAWELMNEPRCTSDSSGRTIQVLTIFPIARSDFLLRLIDSKSRH